MGVLPGAAAVEGAADRKQADEYQHGEEQGDSGRDDQSNPDAGASQYEIFLSSRVMTISGVGRVHSRFAMKNIKGAATDL
jgi:hypothetical protein